MTQTFNRLWKEIGEDRKPLREDQKDRLRKKKTEENKRRLLIYMFPTLLWTVLDSTTYCSQVHCELNLIHYGSTT
jgi:hypothetical protein